MKEGKVNKARPVLFFFHVYSKRVDGTSLCPRSIQTHNTVDSGVMGLYHMRNTPFIDGKLVYRLQTHSPHTSSS